MQSTQPDELEIRRYQRQQKYGDDERHEIDYPQTSSLSHHAQRAACQRCVSLRLEAFGTKQAEVRDHLLQVEAEVQVSIARRTRCLGAVILNPVCFALSGSPHHARNKRACPVGKGGHCNVAYFKFRLLFQSVTLPLWHVMICSP